jgi:hypothetical protein
VALWAQYLDIWGYVGNECQGVPMVMVPSDLLVHYRLCMRVPHQHTGIYTEPLSSFFPTVYVHDNHDRRSCCFSSDVAVSSTTLPDAAAADITKMRFVR